jgi:hypothetical protein
MVGDECRCKLGISGQIIPSSGNSARYMDFFSIKARYMHGRQEIWNGWIRAKLGFMWSCTRNKLEPLLLALFCFLWNKGSIYLVQIPFLLSQFIFLLLGLARLWVENTLVEFCNAKLSNTTSALTAFTVWFTVPVRMREWKRFRRNHARLFHDREGPDHLNLAIRTEQLLLTSSSRQAGR